MSIRSVAFLLAVSGSLVACSHTVASGEPSPPTQSQDLAAVASSVITFGADGAPQIDQAVVGGGHVKVSYDAKRLLAAHPECITNTGFEGSPLGVINMGFRFNGDAARTYPFRIVAAQTSSSIGPRIANELPIPSDVRKLELWFSCGANVSHDQVFDSRDGANYVFTVDAPALASEVQTVRTAINGSIDLRTHFNGQTESGSSFSENYTLTLTYDDLSSFAGSDYQEIHAFVGTTTHVAHHGGLPSAPTTSGQTVTLTRTATGKFSGTFDLHLGGELSDSEADLDGIAVAISNDQGNWDSDGGKNYSFR